MGEVYAELGEEKKMLAAYMAAATMEPVDARTNAMEIAGTRSRAHVLLGDHYLQKQDWDEALKWWQGWKPAGWCGTGARAMDERRIRKIAVCLRNLGRESEAMRLLEQALFQRTILEGAGIGLDVVDIYRQAGKLPEIEGRLRRAARKDHPNAAVGAALQYIELIGQSEKQDYEALWRNLDGHPFVPYLHSWKVIRSEEMLAAEGERLKPFLLKKMAGTDSDPLWAAVLLAEIKAAGALDQIKERIVAENNAPCLMDYFYALAKLGTGEAYAEIRRHAKTGTGNHRTAAQEILDRYPPPEE